MSANESAMVLDRVRQLGEDLATIVWMDKEARKVRVLPTSASALAAVKLDDIRISLRILPAAPLRRDPITSTIPTRL